MQVTKHLPGLPIERALGVVSGRWKAVIIYVLLNGPQRICVLENNIQGISQKVLIGQLRALESHGLVCRLFFAEEPQRIDYALTALGMSLEPLLQSLYDWGVNHAKEMGESHRLLPCEAVVNLSAERGE
jgi:DNA-binding HxlR family transcriptional regulator